MSISTGLGDDGDTELLLGVRVPKDHPRIEVLGTLDELNAFLGDAKAALPLKPTADIIESVQRDLFAVAGVLAAPGSGDKPDADSPDENGPGAVGGVIGPERLTALVREIEAEHPMRGFSIPGANPASAKLDIARTVCRRAERRLISLARLEGAPPRILRYMNRLSDLLFLLARTAE
jgi:cob(I)alamin adenosyltransferase